MWPGRSGYSAARPASSSKRLPWARPARRSRKRYILNVSRRGGPGSFCGMQITRYWPQETWESEERCFFFFFRSCFFFLKSGECAASRLSLAATRTLTAAPSKWGPTSTDPARPKTTLRRPALEVRMEPGDNQGIYIVDILWYIIDIIYMCRYVCNDLLMNIYIFICIFVIIHLSWEWKKHGELFLAISGWIKSWSQT